MNLAFLHTSQSHIEKFDHILNSLGSNIKQKHYIKSELIDYAIKNNKTDSINFKNIIDKIKLDKPDFIICTCSTYGEEAEKYDNVFRIDKPICEFIVNNYSKMGLVYTAKSTASISKKLLEDISKNNSKKISIIDCDCSEQWIHFEKNNIKEYEQNISNSIKKIEKNTDVIFLAQASMDGVKKILTNFKIDILSSPRYGVEQIIKSFNKQYTSQSY